MRLPRPVLACAVGGFLAALILAGPARAVSVQDYQKWRYAQQTVRATPTGLIEVRIGGILQGLMLANARLAKAGGPVLFCPPAGAPEDGMESGALRTLLDKELKAPSRPGGAPWPPKTGISVVILKILQRTWPCGDGRKVVP